MKWDATMSEKERRAVGAAYVPIYDDAFRLWLFTDKV